MVSDSRKLWPGPMDWTHGTVHHMDVPPMQSYEALYWSWLILYCKKTLNSFERRAQHFHFALGHEHYIAYSGLSI